MNLKAPHKSWLTMKGQTAFTVEGPLALKLSACGSKAVASQTHLENIALAFLY